MKTHTCTETPCSFCGAGLQAEYPDDLRADRAALHERLNQARADREALRTELLGHIDAHIEAGKSHQREATQAMEALKELGLAKLSDVEKYPSLRRVLQPETQRKDAAERALNPPTLFATERSSREFIRLCLFVAAGITLVGIGVMLGGGI